MALLGASIFSALLHAQSTEAELKARLKNKPLYLRGFWRDDTLHFDSTGQIIGGSPGPLAFTLSGFDLKSIRLQPNKLILEGQRVGIELAHDKQKRVPLKVGDPRHSEDELIHIEIDAHSPRRLRTSAGRHLCRRHCQLGSIATLLLEKLCSEEFSSSHGCSHSSNSIYISKGNRSTDTPTPTHRWWDHGA